MAEVTGAGGGNRRLFARKCVGVALGRVMSGENQRISLGWLGDLDSNVRFRELNPVNGLGRSGPYLWSSAME